MTNISTSNFRPGLYRGFHDRLSKDHSLGVEFLLVFDAISVQASMDSRCRMIRLAFLGISTIIQISSHDNHYSVQGYYQIWQDLVYENE